MPVTGCTIDDLVFSAFDYGSSAQGGATAIVASGVSVTPLVTPGNPGFRFGANWSASSNQISDSTLSFTVATLNGAAVLLDDASLVQLAGAIRGTGLADVGEGICAGPDCQNTTFMLSTLNTSDAALVQLGDHQIFSPTGILRASKDIGVSGGFHGFGSVSSLTDQFSEKVPSVPEPGTIVLFGTGMLGCVAGIRRRRMVLTIWKTT
jgi:hypothetical protein